MQHQCSRQLYKLSAREQHVSSITLSRFILTHTCTHPKMIKTHTHCYFHTSFSPHCGFHSGVWSPGYRIFHRRLAEMLRTIYSNRHRHTQKAIQPTKKIYVRSSYHNKSCHACKQVLLEKSTFLIYTVHVHVDEHLKCRLNLPLHAISFVMVLALHKLQYYPVKAMLSINNHRQN